MLIGGKRYELIVDHKNGWNPAAFRDRYSDVLERYDYIIGDWGYNQLRLKGFFKDNHPKGNKESFISGLVDYINEYCNFGCAYFVIHRPENAEGAPEGSAEQDLLTMPIISPDQSNEEGAIAMTADGEPIILREHIRKPHPSRNKEQAGRSERSPQDAGGKDGSGGGRSDKAGGPLRKEGRSGGGSRLEQREGADKRGSERRGQGEQARGNGEQQARGNGAERRSAGEQHREGGHERRSEQQRVSGERRGAGEQSRGASERRGAGEQQAGGAERRGGEQPRGGGAERRIAGEHREGGDEGSGESRRPKFKHRKGQKRLPMPPREQTVAATSEAVLGGGPSDRKPNQAQPTQSNRNNKENE
ncbi:DUF1027 domain-containing protein [Paenibacillus sp. MMS18-CY102]|nr:DUF1027 domain-containing protein [Paenibacillus sp. MMS18-CY102]